MPDVLFRELTGEYVENAGQVVMPREFLDYLEPLGSALSRLPDGAGGPFVYQFRGSGGRVVGAMGWVVSAASKRYGGWNLWGVWTDGPIPALSLPLLWPELRDRRQLPALLRRANDNAEALQLQESSQELLDNIAAMPLHDDELRTALKIELTRLYRVPFPDERPMELDLSPAMLDLLPWVYLLGPVQPGVAQLQPSRFNGAGYQYILNDAARADGDIVADIDRMVDAAAGDVLQGFDMAAALRERRARPRTKPAGPSRKPRSSEESLDMGNSTPPSAVRRTTKPPARDGTTSRDSTSSREPAASVDPNPLPVLLRAARDVIIIALLAWIAWNVHQLRKSMTGAAPPAAVIGTERRGDEPRTPNEDVVELDTAAAAASAPAATTLTRDQRLAADLLARPPQGMRVQASAASDLPRTAVEIFLRRNNCFARTEPIDGRFSTAEQKAIRNCTSLTTQRLMRTAAEPHAERSLDWLEKTLSAR